MKIFPRFRKLLLAAFVFISFSPFVQASHDLVLESRDLTHFDEIEVDGVFQVKLVESDKEMITIKTKEEHLAAIKTDVRKSILHLSITKNIRLPKSIEITIYYKSIKRIDIDGVATISSACPLNAQDFTLDVSGATKTDIELNAQSFELNIRGSGTCKIKGNAQEVKMNISGAGKFLALDFNIATMNARISGAGKALIFVEEELDVKISGVGTVKYKGDPHVSSEISGVGSVKKI